MRRSIRQAILALALLLASVPVAGIDASPSFAATGFASRPAVDPSAALSFDLGRADRVAQAGTFEVEVGPDGHLRRKGSLIVTFRSNVSDAAAADAHRETGARKVEPVGLPKMTRVDVPPEATDQAIASYRKRPDVLTVEPDYVVWAMMTPNDSLYSQQYGPQRISAPTAWDRTRGSSSVRIAILDCGIFSSSSSRTAPDGQRGHPDLRGKVVTERDFTGSSSGTDDRCDHGTHVAGIAAASGDNGIGIAGVAFNSPLMTGKVLGDDGYGSTSWITSGIVWAADNGAKVINMSLGSDRSCSSTEQQAIDYAWSRGVVIVAAAGNSGLNQSGAPANCNRVISVAATDRNDARASYSNVGANVDVAAPGSSVLSANFNGGYVQRSGTSMASPHVAGLAALVWSTSVGTSAQAVHDRILSTSDRISGTGSFWSAGRVNAAAGVGDGGSPPPSPTPTPAPPSLEDDRFNQARAVTTLPSQLTANTSAATTESGEPTSFRCGSSTVPMRKTLWYTYTPPVGMTLTITTEGSSFDTIIAVWTGTGVSELTPVPNGCNDDTGNVRTSRVSFNATAGVPLKIQVGGYAGASEAGNLVVSLSGTRQVSCSPRPRVRVETARAGSDKIQVEVIPEGTNNSLDAIEFGDIIGAVVDAPGISSRTSGNFTLSLPFGTPRVTFTVSREKSGPATVTFKAVDACGTWDSFVGIGTGAP